MALQLLKNGSKIDPGASWGALGAVLAALRRLGMRLGGAGAALEAYKRRLGGSLDPLGAVLRALESILEPSGSQKARKMEPKRVPNRAPEATRAEKGKTTKL